MGETRLERGQRVGTSRDVYHSLQSIHTDIFFISNREDKQNISVTGINRWTTEEKYPDRGGAVGPTCEEVGDSLCSVLATWAARWQGESSDALRLRSEEDTERQI